VSGGRKLPADPRRSAEEASFAADSFSGDLAAEMLTALHGLGSRDLKIIATLIAKVREVETERGEPAAREMIDAITAILLRRGLSRE
jgi:hypothetical protein